MSSTTWLTYIKEKMLNFIELYGKNIGITAIIHLFMYFVVYLFFQSGNLLINMISIDSLINAVIFIKTLYENKDEIVKNYYMNKTFEIDLISRTAKNNIATYAPNYAYLFEFNNEGYISIIKKYFFFGVLYLLSFICNAVVWDHFKSFFDMFFLLLSTPMFCIVILSLTYFVSLYNFAIGMIKNIIAFVVSKITAKLLNTLSESCLDNSPKIDYYELIDFYGDFNTLIASSLVFIKTVFIQTAIYYGKKTSNPLYYWFINTVEKYQIEWSIFERSSLSNNEKKIILSSIIRKREWRELTKPKTINMIFELFGNAANDNYSTKVGILLRNIEINFIRFLTLWSISSISPVLAIIIDGYFVFFDKRFCISQKFFPYLLASCVLILNNYLIGSLLMVASEILVKPLIEYIDEQNLINKYIVKSPDELKNLLLIPIIWKFTYLSLCIPIAMQYFDRKTKLNGLFMVSCLLSAISSYSLMHICTLFIMSMIASNMTGNTVTNVSKELKFSMIDNYIDDNHKKVVKVANKFSEQIRKPERVKIIQLKDDEDPQRENPCKWLTSFAGY
jgi:hypothetical protein